ncbi:MAG: LysE family translocator [Saprospiraceae bacterium]
MDLQLVFSFIWAATLLAFMPGPDNIMVLTESITKGKRNGVALSVGLSSGVLIHTMAAATGLSLILQSSSLAFQVVKYLGAAYLFYLAYQSWKEQPQYTQLDQQQVDDYNFWKLIQKGFLMNVLNPKVSLFFIAFLPVFVSTSGFSPTIQLLVLGFLFMIVSLVVFVFIAQLSGQLSPYLNNPKFWKITKWGKTLVLSGLGVLLALSKNQ